MIKSILSFILAHKDLISIILNFTVILLTLLGWIIVFLFGLYQQKKQLSNAAKMKVYEKENIKNTK